MSDRTEQYIISIAKANLYALFMIIPIGLLFVFPYLLFYGASDFSGIFRSVTSYFGGIFRLGIFLMGGIVVHELLHALGWVFFTNGKFKSISFGIKWEYFTPYCHCKEPLKRWQFLIGAALPAIVLGIIPVVVSYFTANIALWSIGYFFIASASGDFIAIWMLRKVKKGALVQDHESELGFMVINK